MLAIHYIILSGLATAVASAAHGGAYGKKPWVVFLHFLACPFVAPIFWLVFRRGKQADAELNYYSDKGGEDAIVAAYYFRPLGKLMARVMRYCKANHWPHLKIGEPYDGRRTQQELCHFVVGVVLGILTAPLAMGL